jgi:hypothetical protein
MAAGKGVGLNCGEGGGESGGGDDGVAGSFVLESNQAAKVNKSQTNEKKK